MRCGPYVLLFAFACGCGGGGSEGEGRQRSAQARVAAEPVEVSVSAERHGSAVRFDIRAIGRGARQGAPFEDPAHWRISVVQGRRSLDRLVNGSVAVDRRPAGQTQWDTVVTFSVAYEIRDGLPISIRIKPPGGPGVEHTFEP
jgi:hypothetical protein